MAESGGKSFEMASHGTLPAVGLDLEFASFPGDTIEDKLAHAIKNTPVLVFGKATCPFTLEVNRTFQDLGVKHSLFNVDKIVDGAKVHNALKGTTKQNTVPYVYIGGELIGGCDATKAAHNSGDLFKKLNAVGIHPKGAGGLGDGAEFALPEGSKRPLTTLLYFPEVVDDRAARFNGIWGSTICILVAVFFWTPQAHWVMLGLMVDFTLRFIGGGNISPLGSLSALCCALMDTMGSKPRWVSGQSKQFATLCGVMFSLLAFFFYMMAVHHAALQIVGLAFTCMLGVATILEGYVGFCLGCWMFGLAIQFGLLPEDTFRVYTSVRDEAEYTYEDMNKRLNEGPPKEHRHCIRADGVHTDIDFVYKAKTDNQIKEDFHPIKHVKINHFYIHMGLAGCACAWIFAAPYSTLYAPTPVGYAIAILAALLFVIWSVLYVMKIVYYFPKVKKEWQHPISSNGFVVPFATLILFAYLLMDHSHNFAMACFWAGAPVGMAISLNKIAEWIAYRKDIEHLNVSWMIMPVSNAIAALIGPMLEPQHSNACQFWFATAFMGWLLLFAATFYRTVFFTIEDDRVRPLLAVWVAAPAVLSVAYLSVYPVTLAPDEQFNDFIFINLHWFGIAMTLILLWTFRRGYLGRIRFDMSYWAAGFPSAAIAFSSIAYNVNKPGRFSYAIAVTALAATSVINLVLLLQTAAALVRMRIFTPDYKWGPLSFMRLTHEAFRGAIIRINKLTAVIASSGTVTPEMVADLKAAWAGMQLVHDEHSKHEDQVIFKLQNDFFPGIAEAATHQHEEHHEIMKSKSVEESKAAAQELAAAVSTYSKDMEEHMRFEEDHLAGMQRKHFGITLHKQAVREVFALTPADKWYKIMPWVVNNLPMLHQRVRYLKTFLWALPERAQHIGMMVGLGVDPVQWRRLTDELPEIIPRSAPHHMRYH